MPDFIDELTRIFAGCSAHDAREHPDFLALYRRAEADPGPFEQQALIVEKARQNLAETVDEQATPRDEVAEALIEMRRAILDEHEVKARA